MVAHPVGRALGALRPGDAVHAGGRRSGARLGDRRLLDHFRGAPRRLRLPAEAAQPRLAGAEPSLFLKHATRIKYFDDPAISLSLTPSSKPVRCDDTDG